MTRNNFLQCSLKIESDCGGVGKYVTRSRAGREVSEEAVPSRGQFEKRRRSFRTGTLPHSKTLARAFIVDGKYVMNEMELCGISGWFFAGHQLFYDFSAHFSVVRGLISRGLGQNRGKISQIWIHRAMLCVPGNARPHPGLLPQLLPEWQRESDAQRVRTCWHGRRVHQFTEVPSL
jgi:hypothetical protein